MPGSSTSRSKSVSLLHRAGRPTLSTIPEGKPPARRTSIGTPMPGVVNSATINTQRSSKTYTKLVVLPSEPQTRPLPGELEDEESSTLITKKGRFDLKSEGERMSKTERNRAGYKRLTAYCVAEGLRMKLLAAFLKREHNVGPRVFDEALYVVRFLASFVSNGAHFLLDVSSSSSPWL